MFEEPSQEEANNFLMVFGGHILFQTLYAAVELDLFNKLSEHKELSLAQISKLLDIQQQPARILLLGLTSTKILKRTEAGLYSNSAVAEAALTSHSPKNIISYVKLQHHVMYKGMFHFLESLKANKNIGLKEISGDEPTLYQRLGHDPKLKQIFQDAMHELSVHANADMAQNVDLSDIKFLIDVGGGDGTNTIELVQKFPHLKAAVFDLPAVSPMAQKKINEAQLSDRVSVIPGNCFVDDFPTTADCFIFCHFCTIWSAEKNKILFNKAYKALPINGKIIIFNMMQDSDETGPLTAAIGSPYFLAVATGEGMLYTWKEYETWLIESGFSDIKMVRLERDHGAIIGVKES